jgi:membrane protein DedA with SNARE-associated domain
MRMLPGIAAHSSYLAISVGTYLEGEAVLISAGALAHAGVLSCPLVVLAATVGSAAWGQTWFRIGGSSGQRFLATRPSWHARATVVERWLLRSGLWVLLFGRFIVGMGTALPAIIGASGYAWRRFVVLDSLGALIWATVFACVGCGVDWGARSVLGHSLAWPLLATAGLTVALCSWLLPRLYAAAARRMGRRGDEPQA